MALAAACASTPRISPDLRRKAGAVVLVDGPPPPGFRAVGQVEGFACQKSLYMGGPSFTAARELLKIEAARRGATTVASILCQEEGTSFSDNCWKSIRCVGDAGTMPAPRSAPQPAAQPPSISI
jgi:hypothetical protein